eukprot:tig00001302_g8091.t1
MVLPGARRSLSSLSGILGRGRKIVAIGRNYEAHAKEMKAEKPKEPILFLKPTTSYVSQGGKVEIPAACKDLHHEVELGVVIGETCRDVRQADAERHIAGYTCLLDMTARDIQNAAKNKGLPWTVAKGYDSFTPMSEFIEKGRVRDPHDLELYCFVDNELRQKGNTRDMIFKIPELVAYISSIMTLEPGDVIATGTPEGVGQVKAGQVMRAGITGLVEISFPVVDRRP